MNDNWRRYDPQDLDPILAAALTSFLESGYHGSSMRELAARAGLSIPGVYHHYRSKQQMLVALMDLMLAELEWRTDAACAGLRDDPVAELGALVECLVLFHLHRYELAFVAMSDLRSLEEPDAERVHAERVDLQRKVEDAISRGVRSGDFGVVNPRLAATAIVSMCASLSQSRAAGALRQFGTEEIAATYVPHALAFLGRPLPRVTASR